MQEILEALEQINESIGKCEVNFRELEKKTKIIDQYIYTAIQKSKDSL